MSFDDQILFDSFDSVSDEDLSKILQNLIDQTPVLSQFLDPSQVKFDFIIAPIIRDYVGGVAFPEDNKIEYIESVETILSFIDTNTSRGERLQLSKIFKHNFKKYCVENRLTSKLIDFAEDIIDDPNNQKFFWQFATPLDEEYLGTDDKNKYFEDVILKSIPYEILIRFINQKLSGVIIHECAHLVVSKIEKENAFDQNYFPRVEDDDIYFPIMESEKTEHSKGYKSSSLYKPEPIFITKENFKHHRLDKITQIKKLPNERAIKYLTFWQYRAFEENLVRAISQNSTVSFNSYGRDYAYYFKQNYFYSDQVPGITKIMNELRGITSDELVAYIKHMLEVFKEESIRIVNSFK